MSSMGSLDEYLSGLSADLPDSACPIVAPLLCFALGRIASDVDRQALLKDALAAAGGCSVEDLSARTWIVVDAVVRRVAAAAVKTLDGLSAAEIERLGPVRDRESAQAAARIAADAGARALAKDVVLVSDDARGLPMAPGVRKIRETLAAHGTNVARVAAYAVRALDEALATQADPAAGGVASYLIAAIARSEQAVVPRADLDRILVETIRSLVLG